MLAELVTAAAAGMGAATAWFFAGRAQAAARRAAVSQMVAEADREEVERYAAAVPPGPDLVAAAERLLAVTDEYEAGRRGEPVDHARLQIQREAAIHDLRAAAGAARTGRRPEPTGLACCRN